MADIPADMGIWHAMPEFDPPELGNEDLTFLMLLDRAALNVTEAEAAAKEGT